MNKNLWLLWQGQLVSQLGMQAYTMAMMFWLMDNIGSSAWMSIIMALSMLPGLILSPLAGVLADSCNRKTIIIMADLLRGGAVLLLTICVFFYADNHLLVVSAFAVTGVINSSCKAFFQPAINALIPDLAHKIQLAKSMAFFESSNQATLVVGQVLGGILYHLLGAPLLLLIDAISYFLSALSQSFIAIRFQPQTKRSGQLKQRYHQFLQQLIEGYQYIQSQTGMWPTLVFSASVNFFIAPVMLMLPFYVKNQLHQQAQWYGMLLAAMAIGSIIGYGCAAHFPVKAKHRPWLMLFAIIGFALMTLLLSSSHYALFSATALLIGGVGLGLFNLNSMTLFQLQTPAKLRGRVMSLLMTASSAFLPLGLLVGGGLGKALNNDPQPIYAFCGIGIILTTLTVMLCRSARQFMAGKH
ncbi:MFS transporter [Neptunicella sp.]|uniref:MFS transporter n=1 Tax=Neptunicella sp. TaxID=2125986 RepID=UPI003F68F446